MYKLTTFLKSIITYGKSNKKIVIIDGLFILMIILISMYSLQRFSRKHAVVYVDMTYKRQDWNDIPFPPEYWTLQAINKNDVSYNSLGQQVARVVDVEKSAYDGGRRLFINLVLEFDAIYNSATQTYIYDGNPLLIGKELTLQFGETSFTGIISNIYENIDNRFDNYDKADAEISVYYRNLEPWHAESLRDFHVSDSNGKTLLTTKAIQIKLAEKIVATEWGDVLLRHDPTKRDVVITFILPDVLCKENQCYFNMYQTFAIGQEFSAYSDKTFVKGGSITSVKIVSHDK